MIVTGNWQDTLEPIARKSFRVGVREIPSERGMLWAMDKSDKLTETHLELGDIGSMDELDGSLSYDDMAQGYKMTSTNRMFAKGVKIEYRLVRTDQLDVIKSLPKMLGLAARRRMAGDAVDHLVNAFNTSVTTLDGLQICSTAHTSNQEGVATTQGNRGTSAFGPVAVEATRILMGKYLTNRDERFDVDPDTLIVPDDLAEPAYELISSSGKVNTANNNVNFHKGKYTLIVLKRMSDANNWFMADSDLMKQFCVWYTVDPLDFAQAEDFDGFAAKYKGSMFYGTVVKDWRWVYGHEVS